MKGNEQIELKAQRYLYERAHLSGSCVVTTFDPFDLKQAFIDGAEYGRKQMIEKACEWLNNFHSEDRHCFLVKEDIEAFKQAMEE